METVIGIGTVSSSTISPLLRYGYRRLCVFVASFHTEVMMMVMLQEVAVAIVTQCL